MSDLERKMAFQIKVLKLPEPKEEYSFHPTRRWRFDFAYPDKMLAIECEGGTWGKGKSRHSTGKGFRDDCIKYNEAAILGWTVLRFTSDMIYDGSAVKSIETILKVLTFSQARSIISSGFEKSSNQV